MKLSQLRALLAVAETGSFSEAALHLGVSQSSVSEAITSLEKHLKVSLFERGRQGARLTPVGEPIVLHARTALNAIGNIEQEASMLGGNIEGVLRISTFRSIASHLVPRIMQKVRQDHPGLQIVLQESMICDVPNLLRPLEEGQAELAFIPQANSETFLSWKLLEDPYSALVPKGSVPAGVVGPEELMRQPFLTWKEGDCAVRVAAYLERLQVSPPDIIRAQNDFTMYHMVAQNLGICLTPGLALDYIPEGTELLPLQVPLVRQVSVAVRPGALRIPAVRFFLQQVKMLLPDSELPDLKLEQNRAG